MKCVKSEHRTRLTDKHLKSIFLAEYTNTKPNLDDILRDKPTVFIDLTKSIFCIDFFVKFVIN